MRIPCSGNGNGNGWRRESRARLHCQSSLSSWRSDPSPSAIDANSSSASRRSSKISHAISLGCRRSASSADDAETHVMSRLTLSRLIRSLYVNALDLSVSTRSHRSESGRQQAVKSPKSSGVSGSCRVTGPVPRAQVVDPEHGSPRSISLGRGRPVEEEHIQPDAGLRDRAGRQPQKGVHGRIAEQVLTNLPTRSPIEQNVVRHDDRGPATRRQMGHRDDFTGGTRGGAPSPDRAWIIKGRRAVGCGLEAGVSEGDEVARWTC